MTGNDTPMLERNRRHRRVALALLVVVLVHPWQAMAQQAPPSIDTAPPKPADHGTSTVGVLPSRPGEPAEKPRAADGPNAHSRLEEPARPGIAGGSAAASIVNVAVCAASNDQGVPVWVADGMGGGVVVWQDLRSGSWDVYAQQVGTGGLTQWVPDGVPVCKAAGGQTAPQAVSDGAGGVIVAWEDGRPGTQGRDIYAQRLSAAGVPLWGNGGVPVCTASGDQKEPVVVGDGQGGVVVAWADDRAGGSDVYTQRVGAGGVAQWGANGVALCTASGVQQGLAMVPDGQRGAIVAWQDRRTGTGDIYARRVSESGVAQWAADGQVLCAAVGEQESVAVVEDGAGGALVVWADGRVAGRDVYGQRVSGSGAVQWGGNGVGLCTASGEQRAPVACGDGAGGALVGWQDGRPGAQGQDVYLQRVSGTGVVQWGSGGVGVCTAAGDQVEPAMVSDPMGGAVVVWSDGRTAGSGADIYAQHVDVGGVVQWTGNGVRLCDAANGQDAARVIADGQGGAAVVWRDYRAGASADLYAQRVDAGGQVASQCLATVQLADNAPVSSSGPQGYYIYDQTEFYWSGVGVRGDSGGDWDIEIFQPLTFGGSRYPTCFASPLAGSFASGKVDFVVGDFNIGHTVPVFPGEGYGVRAFRYSGSGPGTVEWDNGPDWITKDCGTGAGCGARSGNSWSDVLDVWDVFLFGGRTYAFDFTRSGSADIKLLLFGSTGTTGPFFVPRSARLFETADPQILFTAPDTAWYGVVLVNDNGQAGEYTVRVVTAPTTGIGEIVGPATGLRGVAPNPSTGRIQIQFALHEPGVATFEVVDMAGRRVARLAEQRRGPGSWSTAWDGTTGAGTAAPPGIYFVQMRVDGRPVGITRLALIR